MHKTLLFIGTGQVGKAILNKFVEDEPEKIIIHNLTKKESDKIVNEYASQYTDITFISSFGNIFMPFELKDLDNKNLSNSSEKIINYFYSELTNETFEKSLLYSLVAEHKPDLIIDAINSATVLGNVYDPEYRKECFKKNPNECCKQIMVDDYTTKIINFVLSLKYSMEKYNVKKYVKVSTTGLGGMGLNMPYTHGDNPKINLSSALMGKISASGVLHQLLWNLSHTKGLDISLVIPATFIGYDSVKTEPIETDKGFLKKRNPVEAYKIQIGDEIKYNNNLSEDYLEFPVVRAGENHVYSQLELKTLTAIGQMEAITKEEVAQRVIECVYNNVNKDIFASMDSAMLAPTYSGREMVNDIIRKINLEVMNIPGIATGNLGVKLSKQLYELYLLKKAFPTIKDLEKVSNIKIAAAVNEQINTNIVSEIITLGIPIITNFEELYIGDYTLIPSNKENKNITDENLKKWSEIGWVDLRESNLDNWRKTLIEVNKHANSNNKKLENLFKDITDDYDIAEYLAYFYNMQNKGRKK